MPYIPKIDRSTLEVYCRELDREMHKDGSWEGKLAFAIYFLSTLQIRPNSSFATRSAVYGILASVLGEFRRRHLDAYEDTKIRENGDITS